MNRIETRVMAGILAAVIGFAPLVFAAASDIGAKAARSKAKSPDPDAPMIARIVVRPSAEQLAELRAERRVAALERRPGMDLQVASGHGAAMDAL